MRSAVLALLTFAASLVAAENELPKTAAQPEAAGADELFRSDSDDVLFPHAKVFDRDFLTVPEAPPTVERAKAAYDQALRKEQRWQKLGRAGVLAQVEVERATLQAARARARYEQARVAQQQAELAELKARVPALPPDTIAAAESALQTAQTMAAEAANSLQRTELLLAETNVDRQRRLLKMGMGSKSMLQKAEAALAQLKAPAP